MDGNTRRFVRRRAVERCEYCHLPQAGHDERFSIDHVIATKHRRDDSRSNLALCCLWCNLFKGTNLSGIDPLTGEIVSLFNPRRQTGREHFSWSGPILTGITPEGRASIAVMRMNATGRVLLRQALMAEGLLTPD